MHVTVLPTLYLLQDHDQGFFPGSLSHSLVGTVTQLSQTSASASQNSASNSNQCVALPLLREQIPP